MSAVLGGDPDEVVAGIEAAGLTPANRNGAGQIVAAGALDALEKLAAEPPAGARVRPLQVAGAFHTHYMAPAEDALRRVRRRRSRPPTRARSCCPTPTAPPSTTGARAARPARRAR